MALYDFDTAIDRDNSASIKWNKYPTDILPMWVADMDFAVAPEIITALHDRLHHPVLGYTEAPDGLHAAVCTYLQSHHRWSVDPQWLVWLPGVVPGVAAACTMAGDSNDSIMVFTPVYHPLLQLPALKDRQRTDVPLHYAVDASGAGRWSIDLEAFEAAITPQCKALLLCSPHNPTGTVFSETELQRVVELCNQHNILIVSDEIHCDLVLHSSRRHITTGVADSTAGNNLITLMSPSKTFNLAGANCSFAVIPNDTLRAQFEKACLYTVPIVPTTSYIAARAAYTAGWPWHHELIQYLQGNLALLRQAIHELPYLKMDDVEATYLAWINTSELPVEDAFEFLLTAGVGLSPGSQFGDGNYQRINFACSRDRLQQGIEKIAKAVSRLG